MNFIYAKNVDPDQTPRSVAASGLSLHRLSRHKGDKLYSLNATLTSSVKYLTGPVDNAKTE